MDLKKEIDLEKQGAAQSPAFGRKSFELKWKLTGYRLVTWLILGSYGTVKIITIVTHGDVFATPKELVASVLFLAL